MQAGSPKAATIPAPARATDVDRHVGARIRERRTLLGLTLTQLAELIGITYQQGHKYETGLNRVSAGRLHRIAGVLGVQPTYFFPDQDQAPAFLLPPHQRMVLELARNFLAISDSRQRQAVCDLVRSFAASAQAEAIGPAGTDRIAA